MGRLKNKKTLPVFNKPFIDLDRKHNREWRHVPVQELAEDDIVAGMGVVLSTQPDCRGNIVVEAGKPNSELHTVKIGTTLFAFVKKG